MRSRHFALHELAPRALYETVNDRLLWSMFDPKLLETIDQIKEKFPQGAMTINNYRWGGNREWSGIRTKDSKWYSPTSQHSVGKAIDAVFSDYDVESIRDYIIVNPDEFPHIKGIELEVLWLHIDTRDSDTVRIFKA